MPAQHKRPGRTARETRQRRTLLHQQVERVVEHPELGERYTLEELITRIDPNNLLGEISTGYTVGNEFPNTSFDDFLKEEGVFEELDALARREVESWLILNAEESKRLMEVIGSPPEPIPAYLRAKEAYVRLIRKAC